MLERSGEAAAVGALEVEGRESEIIAGIAEPCALPLVAGLVGDGDSTRDDKRLSRDRPSRKLLDDARGDGLGRPSLLAVLLPKFGRDGNGLEGDGDRAKPLCIL